MLGIQMLKKLFNKCIEINRIIKAIGLRMRPPAPSATARAPDRSARSRPLASARLAPAAPRTRTVEYK